MAIASHQAELEVESTDVVGTWNALDAVIAQCAGSLGPATKSDYHVGHSDDQSSAVAGADLRHCLARVENPTAISVTYTTKSVAGPEPQSIELKIIELKKKKQALADVSMNRNHKQLNKEEIRKLIGKTQQKSWAECTLFRIRMFSRYRCARPPALTSARSRTPTPDCSPRRLG